MKAQTEQKTGKRILFLKPTKRAPKAAAPVMRKSIEADADDKRIQANAPNNRRESDAADNRIQANAPGKPKSDTAAGNLSHLQPLLDTVRKAHKRRARSKAAQPAPSNKD